MKIAFHIVLLSLTLLWTCAPLKVNEYFSPHDQAKIQCPQDDAGTQSYLLNLASKPDTNVDLAVSDFLPDLPTADIVRFSGHNDWTREHAAYIESHHIYTQVTSSYL